METSGEGRTASRIRLHIGARTARALLRTSALSTPEGWSGLAASVSRRTGRPLRPWPEHTPADRALDVVRHCSTDPDWLSDLAGVVHGMAPGSPAVTDMHRLADEWTAVGSLEGLPVIGSWKFLAEALRPLEPQPYPYKMRSALIWLATEHRLTGPPPHAVNPWHDFLYLAGQNTAPGQLPPWMVYLDLLCTPPMSPELVTEVMARNRKWALHLGLSELLDEERNRAQGSSVEGLARQLKWYLAIRIEPDPLDNTRYDVVPSLMSEGPSHRSVQGQPRHQVPVEQLEDVIATIVQTERRKHPGPAPDTGAPPFSVEFVLPFELMNLPVEWWPHTTDPRTTDPHTFDPHTSNPRTSDAYTSDAYTSDAEPSPGLAAEFPVVVRSLDRLQTREWHAFWNARWTQLAVDEPPALSVCYADEVRDRGRVLAEHLDDGHLVALVLSEPPLTGSGNGTQELLTALGKGLPVVVWDRADWSSTAFRTVLDELLADGLKRFPARVDAYRRESVTRTGGPVPTHHIGRHLTLLWDDAERNPMDPDPT